MKKSGKVTKKENKQVRDFNDAFANFRKEIESTIMKPLSTGFVWPSLSDLSKRIPLVDLADRGNHYELQVEVPGVDKDKISIKATTNAVEVSAEQSKESEERQKGYVYSERVSNSFYRMVPVPEHVVPSKIDAKFSNGILTIKLPKDNSAIDKQPTRVEVK